MPWVYHMCMVVASEMFRPGQDLDSFYVQTATRSNTSQNLCPLSALILTLPFKVTLDVQDFTVETSSDWLHTQASISHNTTHLTRFFLLFYFSPILIHLSIHSLRLLHTPPGQQHPCAQVPFCASNSSPPLQPVLSQLSPSLYCLSVRV